MAVIGQRRNAEIGSHGAGSGLSAFGDNEPKSSHSVCALGVGSFGADNGLFGSEDRLAVSWRSTSAAKAVRRAEIHNPHDLSFI